MARRMALALAVVMVQALGACGNGVGGSDGAGGAGICGTCYDVFVNGGEPCGGTSSSDAVEALRACACQTNCVAECSDNLCESFSSNAMCGACLEMHCAAQTQTCADN